MLGYIGYIKSVERMKKTSSSTLELPEQGMDEVIKEVWKSSRKSYKMDKRLTGSSIIDEPIQEVSQATGIPSISFLAVACILTL